MNSSSSKTILIPREHKVEGICYSMLYRLIVIHQSIKFLLPFARVMEKCVFSIEKNKVDLNINN